LNLATFFPKCRFGNILITTRNPQLSIYADQNADAKVADMDPEDAKCLLIQVSQAKKTNENEKLAAIIVKVLLTIISCDTCSKADYRIFITLHWPFLKLVLTSFAVAHLKSIWSFIKSIMINCFRLM